MTIELYDEEIRKVMEIGRRLDSKYKLRSAEDLISLINEAQYEFQKIGLRVNFTTDERTGNFTFEIVGRVDPRHEFDFEKKQWEVRKGNKTGEKVAEL